jgi:hypothetical protein
MGHAAEVVRTLELFILDADARWILADVHRDDALVRAEPLETVELELGPVYCARCKTAYSKPTLPDTKSKISTPKC